MSRTIIDMGANMPCCRPWRHYPSSATRRTYYPPRRAMDGERFTIWPEFNSGNVAFLDIACDEAFAAIAREFAPRFCDPVNRTHLCRTPAHENILAVRQLHYAGKAKMRGELHSERELEILHFTQGTAHPHDYKLPLYLWDTMP